MKPIVYSVIAGAVVVVAGAAIWMSVGKAGRAQAPAATGGAAVSGANAKLVKEMCGAGERLPNAVIAPIHISNEVMAKLVPDKAGGLTSAQTDQVRVLVRAFTAEAQEDSSESHIACHAAFAGRAGNDLLAVSVEVAQPMMEVPPRTVTLLFDLQPDRVGSVPMARLDGKVSERVDLTGDGQEEWISASESSFRIRRFDRGAQKFESLGVDESFEDISVNAVQEAYEEYAYQIDKAAKPFPIVLLKRFKMSVQTKDGWATDGTHQETSYQWDPGKKILAKVSEQKVPNTGNDKR